MSTFEKLAVLICFAAIAAALISTNYITCDAGGALITSTYVAKNVPKPKTRKSEAKYWQGFMDKIIHIKHRGNPYGNNPDN